MWITCDGIERGRVMCGSHVMVLKGGGSCVDHM